MKHCFNSILAVVAVCAITACSSSFSRDELTGKHGQIWDLVSVDEVLEFIPVVGQTPYLGFRGNEIWGYTGCNSLYGGTVSSSGHIDFSGMACTTAECSNYAYESCFLIALGRATRVRIVNENLEMTDSKGTVILRFRRRGSTKEILAGKWYVERINEQPIDSLHRIVIDEEVADDAPSLSFDIEAAQFSGFTGCNRLLGTLSFDESDANRLRLNVTGSSRMQCADRALEQAMLTALQEVTGYTFENDNLQLKDDNEKVVMTLTKAID